MVLVIYATRITYGLGHFYHDSNYTQGSFAKLLWNLELLLKSTSRELFVGSKSSPIFDAILKGAKICKTFLALVTEFPLAAKPLPPI